MTQNKNCDIMDIERKIKKLEIYIDEIMDDELRVLELNSKLDELEDLLIERQLYYTLRLV